MLALTVQQLQFLSNLLRYLPLHHSAIGHHPSQAFEQTENPIGNVINSLLIPGSLPLLALVDGLEILFPLGQHEQVLSQGLVVQLVRGHSAYLLDRVGFNHLHGELVELLWGHLLGEVDEEVVVDTVESVLGYPLEILLLRLN